MFSLFKKKEGRTISIKISGMHCTSCALNIDGALEDSKGIVEAKTNYAKSEIQVSFDPAATSPEKIIGTIKKLGYGTKL